MKRSDFSYHLPDRLIAQQPHAERSGSRLLVLHPHTGDCHDGRFPDIEHLLKPGDLLVMNDTRVIPARLHGRKETGGKVELLVERVLNEHELLAHVRASKAPKPDSRLELEGGLQALVVGREGDLFHLRFGGDESVLHLLEEHGHMPLPPYIRREDAATDRERYQTVYARKPGAVAAPTAGLHMDDALLARLRESGVELGYVTLHVGAGTFQPVREDDLDQHVMHPEYVEVSPELVARIEATRAQGGRVVALGTTVVRSLESAAQSGRLGPFSGDTRLFIRPGYEFRVVDLLITNFHLPESTLLMLVCAFAGYEPVMAAYRHAVEQEYRFFSYGDAMLLYRQQENTAGGE